MIVQEEYSARECIEYAISCLKNHDSRGCTIKWLERALAQLSAKLPEVEFPDEES